VSGDAVGEDAKVGGSVIEKLLVGASVQAKVGASVLGEEAKVGPSVEVCTGDEDSVGDSEGAGVRSPHPQNSERLVLFNKEH